MNENKYLNMDEEQIALHNHQTQAELVELKRARDEVLASSNRTAEPISDLTNAPNEGIGDSNQRSHTKTLSTPYNIFGKEGNPLETTGFNGTMNNSGFASKLLITLLSGFALGAIAAAVYIFNNLDKINFTI